MQAVYNSFLSDIAELSEIIQPRRKTLVDQLIGRLAVGQIRGEQFLYEVHGPYAVPIRSERPRHSPFARLIPALKAFVQAYARRQKLRRAAQEMSRLDNRMLKDIGLTRLEIEAAAWGRLRRNASD